MNTEACYIFLEETDSTNTYLNSIAESAGHGTVACADKQTAGRGQKGNHWESEPGKNITFSILLRPKGINARWQFMLSEIVSMAIVNVLRSHIGSIGIGIKWPNDIYAGDKKICGILIENRIESLNISHSIAGIGLNVNQGMFNPELPNPVSMLNITGKEYDTKELLHEICQEILRLSDKYDSSEKWEELHLKYCNTLWRKDGYHRYSTPEGELFEARIDKVGYDGVLTLVDIAGQSRSFKFKEVTAII